MSNSNKIKPAINITINYHLLLIHNSENDTHFQSVYEKIFTNEYTFQYEYSP